MTELPKRELGRTGLEVTMLGYGWSSTTTSGQRRRTSAAVRAKPTVFRRGLGRKRSANRSARPKGASMWSQSSGSNRTPTANVGDAKRSKASAVDESGRTAP